MEKQYALVLYVTVTGVSVDLIHLIKIVDYDRRALQKMADDLNTSPDDLWLANEGKSSGRYDRYLDLDCRPFWTVIEIGTF
jgi:hypothetical protein